MLGLSLLSLVALAAASPIPGSDPLSLYRRADVTQSTLNTFDYYVEHASAAYCNAGKAAGTAVTCSGTCTNVEKNNVKILGTYDGKATGISGYTAIDDVRKEIVFSVRGSANIRNWIANLDFDLKSLDLAKNAKVHDGFNKAWLEISTAVLAQVKETASKNAGYKVISVGHSLGGAVATLGAAYLRNAGHNVDIYTYGAPRIGNAELSDFISGQAGAVYRVTQTNDPVPRLPPKLFGYRHVSPEYWLSKSSSTGQYDVSTVKVCTGNANTGCNGSQNIIDINSIATHLSYFNKILSGCISFGLRDVDDVEVVSVEAEGDLANDDDALVAQLNAWAEADRNITASA
ncbi:unnamed protein product [Clonostachys rosea]|uniref:Fungal lipase-type domain-containing protein n=1 Tax=Bionectria ochroleuca TaxID=29856 RepID=A0ABY6UPG9_BIOOC|nr:unnamed protein product [Clonostachys rosea]